MKRFARIAYLAAVAAVALVAGHFASRAQPTVSLPTTTVTTGVTNGAAVSIVGYNPGRRAIQICAFSNSANVLPVNPTGMPVVAPSATQGIPIASGACYSSPTLLTNSGTSGGQTAAWQAIGVSGTAVITVLEY